MMKNDTPIYVNNTQIKNVESYIYLAQRYTTRDKNQDNEIQRRITAEWTVFAKHRDIFEGNVGICLKRQVYNSCMRTSSNDIRRGNMGTHHPSKEQASSRTNKDGQEYVKHHVPGQKSGLEKRRRSQT
ncbi:hypothetical protein NP493_100g07014 [Ridgeia piscesae]|uniref:Uncharacterized protein n=1 Tax=Ridgeia piscesae TaxID=27915 RepID=A0AAD9P7N7_RIDPI|nr:hypothetical protein NP493_100g07014 [Ridgeia piscesae]